MFSMYCSPIGAPPGAKYQPYKYLDPVGSGNEGRARDMYRVLTDLGVIKGSYKPGGVI